MAKKKSGFIIHIALIIFLFFSSLIASIFIYTSINTNKMQNELSLCKEKRKESEDIYQLILNDIDYDDLKNNKSTVYHYNDVDYEIFINNDVILIKEKNNG